jgi:O-antigen/teichoic acid export membrane protein
LFIAGISAFLFFKIGQQALGQDGFKPIVAMWFIAFSLAPGFFLPVEQEVGRAISHRRALHQGGRPVVQRMMPLAIGMLLVLVAIIAASSQYLTKHLLDGYGIVVVCLILTLVSYAPMHLARGICSGSQRFGAYGIIIGADGAARVIGVAVLWALGIQSVGAFALMIALSPLIGVVGVGLAGKLRSEEGPPAPWSEVTPNLGWLLIGSLFAAALVNAGPITVDILGTDAKPELITQFGNAVIFARIPLFLFQAVQAALLPRLARLAAQGKLDEFRHSLRKLLVFVVGVGVVGTAGAFAIGPAALKLVYEGGIDRRTLTLLALSSAFYMVAVAFAQATIALQGHAIVGLGWALGFGSFVAIAAWSSSDLYLRVELALVGSSLVALISFMVALRSRMLKLS